MKKRKAASRDLMVQDLPKNRKEQFRDLLKHRYSLLLFLGLWLFVFALPYLVALIIKDMSLIAISETGESDETALYSMSFTTNLIYDVVTVLTLMVFSVGLAGVLKILKELVYSQPVFFRDDFLEGIRENARPLLLVSSLVGIFSLLENLVSILLSDSFVSYIPYAVNYGLLFPLCYIAVFLVITYRNTFLTNLRTSAMMYFRHFPLMFLCYFSVFALSLLDFLPVYLYFVRYLVLILALFFYLPGALLGSVECHTSLHDRLFNENQFPEYYRKGLFNTDPEEKKKN